jgi:DMSO/TMAO reductase YedYZ molybdopterin-dependent catalytic subunit
MVFSPLHWVPSASAAIMTIALVISMRGPYHREMGRITIILAATGLIGYISAGNFRLWPMDFHVAHSWIGLAALLTSIFAFLDRRFISKGMSSRHCCLGKMAAALAAITLAMGLLILSGVVSQEPTQVAVMENISQEATSSRLPEVEAGEYQGVKLASIRDQGNNAIAGTQYINRSSYRLKVTGLVDSELNMSYDQLLGLPAYSELVYMPCVEGWGFDAKWTGFRVTDLLDKAGVQSGAKYAVFYTVEGYSTGLPLDYLRNESILMAYGLNDLTLPPDRGFPFQLVAKHKYGYKWAKWITAIDVTDKDVRGYWESRGYSNGADAGGPPFG